jgi:hypothetical protein
MREKNPGMRWRHLSASGGLIRVAVYGQAKGSPAISALAVCVYLRPFALLLEFASR